MKRSAGWWVGAGVVLAAGGVYWMSRPKEDGPQWRFAEVKRGSLNQRISATGNLTPTVSVTVGSQVSGTISALYADFNSVVKKDQPIAQIDPTLLQAQLQSDEAAFAKAQANVTNTKSQMDRGKRLNDEKLLDDQDYETLVTAWKQATGDRDTLKANMVRDKANVAFATIRAPVSGTVVSRAVDVGQTVAASFSTPNLFVIAKDLTQMQVWATVDEADIGGVKPGQPALFTVDSFPDTQFRGKVRQVRLQSTVTNNVVTYTVVVDVPNDELKLMPGMTANITIVTDRKENVLKVPNAALRFNPFAFTGGGRSGEGKGEGKGGDAKGPGQGQGQGQGQRGGGPQGGRGLIAKREDRVWILGPDRKPKAVPVTVGISDGQSTEVSGEGLSEGMQILVGVEETKKAAGAATPLGGGMPGGGPRR